MMFLNNIWWHSGTVLFNFWDWWQSGGILKSANGSFFKAATSVLIVSYSSNFILSHYGFFESSSSRKAVIDKLVMDNLNKKMKNTVPDPKVLKFFQAPENHYEAEQLQIITYYLVDCLQDMIYELIKNDPEKAREYCGDLDLNILKKYLEEKKGYHHNYNENKKKKKAEKKLELESIGRIIGNNFENFIITMIFSLKHIHIIDSQLKKKLFEQEISMLMSELAKQNNINK